MAQKTVSDKCGICGLALPDGRALYIGKVNLTDDPYGFRQERRSKGLGLRESCKRLRIKWMGSSTPSVCIHQECFDKYLAVYFEQLR